MRNSVEGFGNVKREKVYGAMGAFGTMQVICKYEANILGTAPTAEAKSVVTKDAFRPVNKTAVNYSLANAEGGIGEVDWTPVRRVFAIAFLVDQNQFAIVRTCRSVASEAVVDLK